MLLDTKGFPFLESQTKTQFADAVLTWLNSFPEPLVSLDAEVKEVVFQVKMISKLLTFFLNSEDFNSIDCEYIPEEVSYEDETMFIVPRTLGPTTKYFELALSNHINNTYKRIIRHNDIETNLSYFSKMVKIEKAFKALNFEKLIVFHHFNHLVNFLELIFRIGTYSSPTSTLSITIYQGLIDSDRLAIDNHFNEFIYGPEDASNNNILLRNESIEDEFNMQLRNYQVLWDTKLEEYQRERNALFEKIDYLEKELGASKAVRGHDTDPDGLFVQSLLWEIQLYQNYIKHHSS